MTKVDNGGVAEAHNHLNLWRDRMIDSISSSGGQQAAASVALQAAVGQEQQGTKAADKSSSEAQGPSTASSGGFTPDATKAVDTLA